MNTHDSIFHKAILKLLAEIFDGPTGDEAYILNPGDSGLLRQLESISAAAASRRPAPDRPPIAAHVDHVLYGIRLMNRWVGGEKNPWAEADWTASWKRTTVTDEEWRTLREQLRSETRVWRDALARVTTYLPQQGITGAIAIVAHLAYHLGAIRQIDRSIRGPSAEQTAP